MKLSIGEKAQRVLTLVFALRNPKVLKILKAHGFTQEDLDEGWKFLRAVAGVRLDFIQNEETVDPLQLRRLDDWENKWFPIISATLNRRYPDLHKAVFLNLTQTQGPAVILSVSTLLKRLKESEKTAEGKAARKLLDSRGVTKAVIADAEDMVEKLSSLADVPDTELVDEEAVDAAQAQAVDAMWAWYLEWSEIARSAIQSRSLLRSMGFLQSRKSDGKNEDTDSPVVPTPL